jgi:hypothetical protein
MLAEFDINQKEESSATRSANPSRSSIVISDPAKAVLLDISSKSGGSIIRAKNDSFFSRTLTVGGAIGAIYGFLTLAPVISIAGVAFLGFYFWGEIRHGMSPQKAEKLALAMSESVPGQPSINDVCSGRDRDGRKLRDKYPADIINRAIEEIWPHCKPIRFVPGDPHPLAVFGQVYCYQDPHDEYLVMTPLEALMTKLTLWGVKELPPKETKPKKERKSGSLFGGADDTSRARLSPAPTTPSPEPQPEFHSFESISSTVVVGSDTKLNAVEVKAEAVDHFDDPWTPSEVEEEVTLAKKEEAKAPPLEVPVDKNSNQRQKAGEFVKRMGQMKPPISINYSGRAAKAWNAADMAMFFPQKTVGQWSNAFANIATHLPGYTWDPAKKMLIKP